MVSVKLECPCGQHYAFEVEPVNGRMPSSVACPACGADGTIAANEFISRNLPRSAVLPDPPSPGATGPRLAAPPPSSAPPSRRAAAALPGQPDRNQVMFEARAKISWGDSPDEVMKYLIIQGFSYAEASEFVEGMVGERCATIRANGIKYIVLGILGAAVPIVTWLVFMHLGFIWVRTFLATLAVGLGGLGLLIKGLFMVFSPDSSSGDVAEH